MVSGKADNEQLKGSKLFDVSHLTALVTGGGTNLGLSIAEAFILASASVIIITGRRGDVLQSAEKSLQSHAKAHGKAPFILTAICDVSDRTQVDALWEFLINQ